MTLAEVANPVQTLHTSSTKALNEPKMLCQQPITFLSDGSPAAIAALTDVYRLANTLHVELSVVHMRGNNDRRFAAALAALPGETPAVTSVTEADLDAALAHRSGILALLPSRPGPLMRVLVGSHYERRLMHGPLSLLALPGGHMPPITRVLFPADLSPRSHASLHQTIELCKALDAELHLLHIFGEDRLLPSEQDLARRAATKSPRELMTLDQDKLRALAAPAHAQGVRTRIKHAEGRAHTQILAYAAENAIDLIVMASHGPRTAEDILLGSTTVRVIQRAPVAVLTMRA